MGTHTHTPLNEKKNNCGWKMFHFSELKGKKNNTISTRSGKLPLVTKTKKILKEKCIKWLLTRNPLLHSNVLDIGTAVHCIDMV